MSRYFLFLILGLSLSAEEAMLVRLGTESELLPIVVTLEGDKELEKVLRFDFSNNGVTTSSNSSPFYEIKAVVKNKLLSAKISVLTSGEVKTIDGLKLTGVFAEDRRVVHRLSDAIFKSIFQKEGIASTRILYVLKQQEPSTKKWTAKLYEIDYDGGNSRALVIKDDFSITPSYIPAKSGYKSNSLLFVSYKTGQPKIYFGTLHGEQTHRFSLLKGNQLLPSISKQRDKIAFISDVTGNPDLFLQDFDSEKGPIGKPRQIYASPKATQGSPSFSPAGDEIAFVSNKDGSPRIYVIKVPPPGVELKNIKAKLITKMNRENTAPAWSPNGSMIAYSAQSRGVRQIWIYDFATHTERQITEGFRNKENPSWAPDSLHLIYNTSDADHSELYLIDINQRKPVKISSGPGEKYFPSWESTGGI